MTILKFTAAQKSQIAVLIKTLLAETAATPLEVPARKTPLIERAKLLGFSHSQGLVIANQALAQFERRAERAQAKLDRAAAATRKYNSDFRSAIADLAATQPKLMQATSRAELKTVLASAGLRTSAAEITRAASMLLRAQVQRAYTRKYRTCVNGTVSVSCGSIAAFNQTEYLEWNLYRGQRRPAKIVNTVIFIRPDYWDRVSRNGIAVICDNLVLDATPVRRAKEGIRVYAATWIEQPRANSNAAHAVRGYLASNGTLRACGTTREEAVAIIIAATAKAAAKAA